ncbi:MAG: amidohydrolase family protein [Caldilineaceae bacterium]
MTTTHRFIDFHSHFYADSWAAAPSAPGLRGLARVWPMITNIEAQLHALAEAGVDCKVLSAPPAPLVGHGEQLPSDSIRRINDHFAALVSSYPGRLLALATVDPFQGEGAAREAERAVQMLGLHGICVDCAVGDQFLDAAVARPTLEAAAALDVPIFVHPVGPLGYTERLGRLGHPGVLLARGTEDAASVLALLRCGILDELPNLKIVMPMIGVAALIFAGLIDDERLQQDGWHGTPPSELRKRLYIDTMGFDSASVRFAVELLGADHVLLGSDWPIMPIAARQRVETLLDSLNLNEADQGAILSGNANRLLKLTHPNPPLLWGGNCEGKD